MESPKTGSQYRSKLNFNTKLRNLYWTLFLQFLFYSIKAQDPKWIDPFEDQLSDQFTQSWLTNSDHLDLYEQDPIDINLISETQLRCLQILSPEAIKAIMQYRKLKGRINFVDELYLLTGIKASEVDALKNYVKTSPLTRISQPAYRMRVDQGLKYKEATDKNSITKFQGDQINAFTKFRVNNQKWALALSLQKDPGEDWWRKKTGPDFFSAALVYHFNGLKERSLYLGDFQYNHGFGGASGLGQFWYKSPVINQNVKPAFGFRINTSLSEYQFYRGIGYTERWGKHQVDLFISSNRLSTNPQSQNPYTPLFSGLHRSPLELSRRKNGQFQKMGLAHTHLSNKLDYGFTLFAEIIKVPERKALQQGIASAFFSKYFNSGLIGGELSLMAQSANLIIHSLYRYNSFLGIYIQLREIQNANANYTASLPLSSSSSKNERGMTIGLNLEKGKQIHFRILYDRYAKPQYWGSWQQKMTRAQYIYELNAQSAKKWHITSRVTLSQVPKDSAEAHHYYTITPKKNIRIDFKRNLTHTGSIQLRMERCYFMKTSAYLFYLDALCKLLEKPWYVRFRLTKANIPGWDQRIYAYEFDVPGFLSFPVYHTSVLRACFQLERKLGKYSTIWVKYGVNQGTFKSHDCSFLLRVSI